MYLKGAASLGSVAGAGGLGSLALTGALGAWALAGVGLLVLGSVLVFLSMRARRS